MSISRIIAFLMCFQLGVFGASQASMNNDILIANAFYSILALQPDLESKFVKTADQAKEIFDRRLDINENEQIIRVLKFEQALLYGNGKPLISHDQVFKAKSLFPGKELKPVKERMMFYMKYVIDR